LYPRLPAPAPQWPRGAETCPGALCRRPARRGACIPSPRWCGRVSARALPGRGAAIDSCRADQAAIGSRRCCGYANAFPERRRPTACSDDAVRYGRVSGRPLAQSAAAGTRRRGRGRWPRRRRRPLRRHGGCDAAGIGDGGVPRGPGRPFPCRRVLGGPCGPSLVARAFALSPARPAVGACHGGGGCDASPSPAACQIGTAGVARGHASPHSG